MAVNSLEQGRTFEHPLYDVVLQAPGLTVATGALDELLSWGVTNALWIFPMATSCCGIEFMASAASRVDTDRMGVIVRATPRQADVMVVAGTITVKMAPRVLKLWEQMPEPRYCVAMGSCAISGDFYRNLYAVVPGIDTFLPVDVYVPGCPPNPEALMHGMLRLQERIRAKGKAAPKAEQNAELLRITRPSVPRLGDPTRPAGQSEQQARSADTATHEEVTAPVRITADAESPVALTAPDFAGLLTELGLPGAGADGPPLVPAAQHLQLARRLKAIGYRQFVSVIATHWAKGTGRKGPDATAPEHFEVTYLVRTIGAGSRVAAWAVRLEVGQPVLTLSGVYAGADWQEREQYDLVGIPFAGHPDLRRLMMMENYQGHPLRRDFASDAAAAPWR